jgi:hypothetical protein
MPPTQLGRSASSLAWTKGAARPELHGSASAVAAAVTSASVRPARSGPHRDGHLHNPQPPTA